MSPLDRLTREHADRLVSEQPAAARAKTQYLMYVLRQAEGPGKEELRERIVCKRHRDSTVGGRLTNPTCPDCESMLAEEARLYAEALGVMES